jgi:hypothetical protein
MTDLQDTINDIVSDLNRELTVNFNSIIDRLADANVNMSQINSVGVVAGFSCRAWVQAAQLTQTAHTRCCSTSHPA